MHSLTQILLGMAAAGVVAGVQHPWALVTGAVAGVLPDLIDWWLQQVFLQPDITVTPDPLAPAPATIAQGLRLALQQVRVDGCGCVLRLNPLPLLRGGFAAYQLDCDRHHSLVVAMASGAKAAPVAPAASQALTPLHPLPLCIRGQPVTLQFCAAGKRLTSRDLARVPGAGHGLPVASLLIVFTSSFSIILGLATASAVLMHLLCDAGSRRELAPWLPFRGRSWHGRRHWNECSWRANLIASLLAGASLMALLAAR